MNDTKTTHTPGPWDYAGSINGPDLIIYRKTGKAMPDALAMNGGPGYVATVRTRASGLAIRGTEAEANARIIAAAPDLLAALKLARRQMADELDRRGENDAEYARPMQPDFAAVCNAIAAAEPEAAT